MGGIRTALFAYLVAKQAGGSFILRLEDTDQARKVEGSEEHLIKSLLTLGLEYDEGPNKPGRFGPYRQSERLEIYKKWAQKLIDAGRAYADPYTPEEVQSFREQAQKEKRPFLYRNHRPENPPTWDGTQPLRFKSDPKSYQWHDEVMGDLKTGPEVIDDIILIKSDGFPTYNFAHIVDDAEMKVTHIMRSQEFIASQPIYLNLYEALEIERPIIATLPPIMNEQGNKKLGKRDGAKDVLDYIHEGFLPDALISFIATLGWNDGTEQEVFTREELIEKFSLQRVGKSGAQFDQRRLLWTNGHFIRQLPLDQLYAAVSSGKPQSYWPDAAKGFDETYKKQVLGLVQERMKYLAELPELTNFFFEEPVPNLELITGNKQLKKLETVRIKELLEVSKQELTTSEFTPEALQETLNKLLEQTGEKPAVIFSLIRIATTWAPASPQLNTSLAVLGKETVLRRMTSAINAL